MYLITAPIPLILFIDFNLKNFKSNIRLQFMHLKIYETNNYLQLFPIKFFRCVGIDKDNNGAADGVASFFFFN